MNKLSLGAQIKILLQNRMYVLVTFGYAAYMYYNGGMVIWQIDFVEEHFGI